MSDIKIASIVAMAENRVIGKNNDLPWRISEDLRHFKRITMGKPIIMGRKCFESLGRPLPGRANIVISRTLNGPPGASTKNEGSAPSPADPASNNEETNPSPSDLNYVKSIEGGVELSRSIAGELGANEIFIIGGGEIYKQTLPMTERLYLTLVHKDYDGDTFFPEFDWEDWAVTSEEKHEGDPAFTFFTLERKGSTAPL